MATAQQDKQPATNSLQEEIKKLELQLAEKTALLNKQQEEKINTVINNFISEIEKQGFSKVEVKKIIMEKLTRKHKARK
jgi:DNA-binding transcriptional regulator YhcF (GntR family)